MKLQPVINVFIKHPDNKRNSKKNGTQKTLVTLLHITPESSPIQTQSCEE